MDFYIYFYFSLFCSPAFGLSHPSPSPLPGAPPPMPRPDRLTPSLLATAALLAGGVAPLPEAVARVREALRNDLPSRADYEEIERGYYEQILDAGAGAARARGAVSN